MLLVIGQYVVISSIQADAIAELTIVPIDPAKTGGIVCGTVGCDDVARSLAQSLIQAETGFDRIAQRAIKLCTWVLFGMTQTKYQSVSFACQSVCDQENEIDAKVWRK